ncbi:unnamed protein product [Caenorhabditis angaria]|uniref:DSBA-like thioredoxin domain-containing protein n=1 Tax=Caenorhabditis angaria TaxID=860376 RepID=A0A9P1MWS5_9PELO|nr:unnamed protein product [Caenorhabditis angaria]
MSSLPKLKCYFDVVCPNSWMTLQILSENSSLFETIEYSPVCDFKIGILHNGQIWNQRRKQHTSRIWKPKKQQEEEIEPEPEGILRRIDERGKQLLNFKTIEAPKNWSKTYKNAIKKGSIIPQLYLTSIKERCPDLYEEAIQHLGKRLWDEEKPVHYGCHMSTVSRELGIPFRIAEDIVARLSTPENRHILNRNCKEALDLKLTEAPGVIIFASADNIGEKEQKSVKFDNVLDLLSSDYVSKSNNDAQISSIY